MTTLTTLTTQAALGLLAAAAHTADGTPSRYGDPDPATEPDGRPRTVVHAVTGMLIGRTWDLSTAIALINDADSLHLEPNIVAHDLAVTTDGQTIRFDVRPSRPDSPLQTPEDHRG